MNVLRPPLVWVEGRCYRKSIINPIFQPNAITSPRNESSYRKYEEPDTCDIYYDDDAIDTDIDIQELENGAFKTTLSVPSTFFGLIIGARGAIKKRLENETGTRITVRNDPDEIVVTGPSRKGIESAKIRIDSIVDGARQKTQFTHFLSIPLNDQACKNGFLDFKDAILRSCDKDRGVDGGIFQNEDKLHLTIGTLVILNQSERNKAKDILQECQTSVIEPLLHQNSFQVTVEGIEYMNDDPSEVNVLYAKVKSLNGTDWLQELADNIVQKFLASGLMLKQYERIKLHLTIMNSSFQKNSNSNVRETFDARNILNNFENHYFAKTTIKSLHISSLHTVGKDGYYAPSCKIDF